MTVRTVLVFALVACRGSESPRATPVKLDPHSHAVPNRVAVRHLSLELTVDFARKTLAGTAVLSFVRHDPTARELVLDSDGLVIEAVTDCQTHQPLAHTLGARSKVTAQALSIALPARGDCIDVAYHTAPRRRRPAVGRARGHLGQGPPDAVHAERRRSSRGPGSRCRTRRACASPTTRRSTCPRGSGR